ncbi:MAG: lysine--tRNA ligase, partial [Flavisolibacter sp.]|nr:lysine--tRNA ligase [Flavisolibacter sp.]
MQTQHLSEQERVRRDKLAELQKLGIDPYPAALYPVDSYSTVIKNTFTDDTKEAFAHVCLAGRIMSVRDMGKASFAVLQDAHGRIQIYVRKDDLTKDGDT